MGAKIPNDERWAQVRALIPVLQRGTDLKPACKKLKFKYTTIRDWIKQDKAIRTEINAARAFLQIVAENVVGEAIINDKNIETAKWWLERRLKDKYSTKQEVKSDIDIKDFGKTLSSLKKIIVSENE